MTRDKINCLELAKKLMSFPSITPQSAGCIEYIASLLKEYSFKTEIICEGPEGARVTNLYAFINEGKGPNLCFAGHIDVVPVGDEKKWTSPPFKPEIRDGKLYGRGAVDMKGAIAAMIVAARNYLEHNDKAQIIFLITSDEEGPAIYGTKVLLESINPTLDFCILGEPTYKERFGDVVQVARRGSASFLLEIYGKQGHVAYDNFINPHSYATKIAALFEEMKLDEGNGILPPSKLNITSFDTDNMATNIVPDKTTIRFNIRYNNLQNVELLTKKLNELISQVTQDFTLALVEPSPEPYMSDIEDEYVKLFVKTVEEFTNQKTELTAYGGASDGRFIRRMCQVVEFGLGSSSAHQVDEHLVVSELENLSKLYGEFLVKFFDTQS
ncbi:succinyl-diaminopimelate desuccinylase [Candidatus Phycorickettsia trachydisci]|uniref:Succinyl-diaminopimelate desuccinylase n=1 Tax=Candidatus Phycorickettsia trachydisci TaxID=2115978 RepID=A0A2P1P893_9RICK|nr:succinyl-diaminopimelate desuccinylase [Candidatus Phycorickettsia trachydisci]AVP87498.1 succinyl-diaminopimelate desuccinylase [Candidatus Phycorickettsia trachydisci]